MIQLALPIIVAELTIQFIYSQLLFLIISTFTFAIYYSMNDDVGKKNLFKN